MTKAEQETVIVFTGDEVTAQVYTCDPKWRRKMKKIHEKHSDVVVLVRQDEEGDTYTVPKTAVSVTIRTGRVMTEEQKAAARERLAKARQKRETEI